VIHRVVVDAEPVADLRAAFAHAPPPGDRQFVRVNMIASIDGAISVHGRSAPLGGVADREVFATLRGLADVIVVGAGTFRREGYGPAVVDDLTRTRRAADGQTPVPAVAVVTKSCRLDWSSSFFTDAVARPVVLTTAEGAAGAPPEAGAVADVVAAGRDHVDVSAALERLHERGARSVLVEGGPHLVGQFAAAGLLDELCVTRSPLLVGGDGPALVAGAAPEPPVHLSTVAAFESDGFVFCRYAVVGPATR
jgi:riboflavin biosynthesis pyrimidine reductase